MTANSKHHLHHSQLEKGKHSPDVKKRSNILSEATYPGESLEKGASWLPFHSQRLSGSVNHEEDNFLLF